MVEPIKIFPKRRARVTKQKLLILISLESVDRRF